MLLSCSACIWPHSARRIFPAHHIGRYRSARPLARPPKLYGKSRSGSGGNLDDFYRGRVSGTFLDIWLQQTALKLTSAAIAQTLVSVSPLFALGLARPGGQKISRRSPTGSTAALAGIALFFRQPDW